MKKICSIFMVFLLLQTETMKSFYFDQKLFTYIGIAAAFYVFGFFTPRSKSSTKIEKSKPLENDNDRLNAIVDSDIFKNCLGRILGSKICYIKHEKEPWRIYTKPNYCLTDQGIPLATACERAIFFNDFVMSTEEIVFKFKEDCIPTNLPQLPKFEIKYKDDTPRIITYQKMNPN